MKFFAAITILFFTTLSHADFVVSALKGSATADSKPLSLGSKIVSGSTLESSSADTYLRVKSERLEFALAEKFKFQLPKDSSRPDEINLAQLVFGKVRALVQPHSGTEPRFRIKTPIAVAGVRGTDFFISHFELLGESEMICFQSEVDFASNSGDTKALIKAGHWGGLGGRFGKKIAPPIELPKNVLETFSKALPIQ